METGEERAERAERVSGSGRGRRKKERAEADMFVFRFRVSNFLFSKYI
jgi:hypothetical protein